MEVLISGDKYIQVIQSVARRRLAGGLPSCVSGTILLAGACKPLAYGTRLCPSHATILSNGYTYPQTSFTIGSPHHSSFSIRNGTAILRWGPITGVSNARRYGKILIFDQCLVFFLEMI